MNHKIVLLIALVLIGAMIVEPASAVLLRENASVGSEVVVSGFVYSIEFDHGPYMHSGTFFILMGDGWFILGDKDHQGYGIHASADDELVWQIQRNCYQEFTFRKNHRGWELVQISTRNIR